MHVRLNPTHRVEICARRLDDLVRPIVIEPIFDPRCDHRQTIFRVPRNVEIDFRIDAVGHRVVY